MNALIVRLEQTEQGALGVLVLDKTIFSFTLEPDINDSTRFYIPEGDYLCKRFIGTKWPDTFEIIISGHNALLFHAGNVETDSEGCVLLGATTGKLKGNRAVLNSGDTFKAFMEYAKDIPSFPLKIVDYY